MLEVFWRFFYVSQRGLTERRFELLVSNTPFYIDNLEMLKGFKKIFSRSLLPFLNTKQKCYNHDNRYFSTCTVKSRTDRHFYGSGIHTSSHYVTAEHLWLSIFQNMLVFCSMFFVCWLVGFLKYVNRWFEKKGIGS